MIPQYMCKDSKENIASINNSVVLVALSVVSSHNNMFKQYFLFLTKNEYLLVAGIYGTSGRHI